MLNIHQRTVRQVKYMTFLWEYARTWALLMNLINHSLRDIEIVFILVIKFLQILIAIVLVI